MLVVGDGELRAKACSDEPQGPPQTKATHRRSDAAPARKLSEISAARVSCHLLNRKLKA